MKKNKEKERKKKLVKIWSLVFLFFLFTINTYAWFTYISKVSNKIDGKVVEWDVIFSDINDNSIEGISFNINKMYPGMTSSSTTYVARNNSDLDAYLDYRVSKFTLFGKEYISGIDYQDNDLEELFTNTFPFTITMTKSSDIIQKKSQINFDITVSWDYELEDKYYRLNNFYEYLADMEYLVFDGTSYVPATVTADDFESFLEDGLYLSSDYADTYWGEMSKLYSEIDEEHNSLLIELEFTVKQV